MDEVLIANYCNLVKPQDTVIIGGDFAWSNHAKYLAQLPGKKTLVWGNHDNMPLSAQRNFTRVVGSRRQPGILELSIKPYTLTVCHFPLTSWNASFHGSWHVHGHCHGRLVEPMDMFRTDLGVDVTDYCPVNFDVVVRKFERRRAAWRARRIRLAAEHAGESPIDASIPNRNENRILIAQWQNDVKEGRISGDYPTRYLRNTRLLVGEDPDSL
jgi:calcineurin-like phosphoesterase family protein